MRFRSASMGGLVEAGILREGLRTDGSGVDEGVVEDLGAGVVEDLFDVLGGGEAEALGAGHGADPRDGREIHRHRRLCRRRRTLPRRPRAADGHAGLGRAEAHRAGLRADERAARRALAGAADGAHHRRVLPRPEAPERAAADGQRVPLRPGRQPNSRACSGGCPPGSATSRRSRPRLPALQERIASVAGAAVTAIQAVYVPADDFTDPAVTAISSAYGQHDRAVARARRGGLLSRRSTRWPRRPRCSIRPWSSARIITACRRARPRGPGPVQGPSRTSSPCSASRSSAHADREVVVKRARRLQRFLSQPFAVTEAFTGTPGRSVSRRAETIAGCRAILDGETDDWAEGSLYMVGNLDEARAEGSRRGQTADRAVMNLQHRPRRSPTVVDEDARSHRLRGEDASGAFGILPGPCRIPDQPRHRRGELDGPHVGARHLLRRAGAAS